MTLLLDWPAALEAAGVNVRLLDGWDRPAKAGYDWREPDKQAAGMMHHHTASTSYNPNRDKANGYPGLGREGTTRLYQEDYGDHEMFPVFTIANAYPAPISSGFGVRAVLEDYVKRNVPFSGRPGPDDSSPRWAGNTHYINIEWILDGTGSWIDERVWDMMVTVAVVTNELMTRPKHLWTPARHIGHGHHTGRKIDLWGGQFSNTNRDGFDKTIQALRAGMGVDMKCPWNNLAPWTTTYPQCDSHFDGGAEIEWGVNTGICNIHSWAEDDVQKLIDNGRIKVADNNRDDGARMLNDERYWVTEGRAT